MDALEFYIGELEEAVAEARRRGVEANPHALSLIQAAEAVIIAWDAENTPPEA